MAPRSQWLHCQKVSKTIWNYLAPGSLGLPPAHWDAQLCHFPVLVSLGLFIHNSNQMSPRPKRLSFSLPVATSLCMLMPGLSEQPLIANPPNWFRPLSSPRRPSWPGHYRTGVKPEWAAAPPLTMAPFWFSGCNWVYEPPESRVLAARAKGAMWKL